MLFSKLNWNKQCEQPKTSIFVSWLLVLGREILFIRRELHTDNSANLNTWYFNFLEKVSWELSFSLSLSVTSLPFPLAIKWQEFHYSIYWLIQLHVFQQHIEPTSETQKWYETKVLPEYFEVCWVYLFFSITRWHLIQKYFFIKSKNNMNKFDYADVMPISKRKKNAPEQRIKWEDCHQIHKMQNTRMYFMITEHKD